MDGLDETRVAEIRLARIIEGDMAVFSDAQDAHVHRMRQEKRLITVGLRQRIGRLRVDVVDGLELRLAEDALTQEIAKALRGRARQPDVLVHMERVDAAPVNFRVGNQRGQHVVLRRSGGKHHVELLLHGQQQLDHRRNIMA